MEKRNEIETKLERANDTKYLRQTNHVYTQRSQKIKIKEVRVFTVN